MMENTVLQTKIAALLPNVEFRNNEPMSKHTSFRIGGPAEVMAFPKTREELAELLKLSAILDCKSAILGAKVISSDKGDSKRKPWIK